MEKGNICDIANVVNDTLEVIDIRDNHIYTIGKLQDNKCWLLDNLALDISSESVRNNMTPNNTNTVKAGIDYLQYYTNSTSYPAISAIITDHNNEARTSGSSMLEGEETWRYGNLYNLCAASGGTVCHERYDQGIEDEPFDICPAGWRLPTGGTNGEYNDLAEAIIGKRGITKNVDEISAYRSALHMPFAGQVRMNNRYFDDQAFYWAKTISSPRYSYGISASGGSYPSLDPDRTSSNEYASSVRCIADDDVYRISFIANGGDITFDQFGKRLEPGSSIDDLPEITRQGYAFDGWYTEITGGEKISSGTVPSGNSIYYAHWINQSKTLEEALNEANKEKVSVGDNEYYKLQDIDKAICDATTNIDETLDAIDIRDNTIYKIGKRKDGNCWLLDNLRLDISNTSVRANMTPENTNTTQTGIDKLAEVQVNVAQTEGITTPHIYTTNKDHSRTTGERLLDGEAEWKNGIGYNACALFGGEFCEKTSSSKPTTGIVQNDICPSNWRVPSTNNYTNLMTSYSIHGSGSKRYYIDDVTRIRSALRLPVNSESNKEYWTSRYFQDQHGFTYEFYAFEANINHMITNDTYSFVSVARNAGDATARCIVDDRATVTFDANGGQLSPDKTTKQVDFDGKIGEMPEPTQTNMRFLGWFTEQEDGEQVTTDSVFTANTTIYAHWSADIFPIVWSHNGVCTFFRGTISGDNCDYADNSYIDTGIALYTDKTYDKDYEIYFEIEEYGEQTDANGDEVQQATLMNEKYENKSEKWPGIVVRDKDLSTTEMEVTETIKNNKASKSIQIAGTSYVRIIRESGVVYYETNSVALKELQNLNNYEKQYFSTTTWFGAASDSDGNPFRFFNGKLKNMYIRMGKRPNGDIAEITFDPNGGTVSPTTLHVVKGNMVGSLPTPKRTNYYFIGWYTSFDGSGNKINSSTIVNDNITYHAIWGKSIEGATIDPEDKTIEKDEQFTINVSNVDEGYSFTSNDKNVATVDANGQVTGIGVGETTITITGAKSKKTRTVTVKVKFSLRTITYDAFGGQYADESTTKTITYKVDKEAVTKYSHTQNIDETGAKQSDYGNNWTNAQITGTDRGDTSKAHVVTIPNAKSITVDIYYNGQNYTYDWVTVWEGSHPDYTAASNYSSGIADAQRLGGSQTGTFIVNGNTLSNMGHKTLTITGDTVTFGFKSNGSYYGNGYGYYAIITGESNTAEIIPDSSDIYEEPTNSTEKFDGWCATTECNENDKFTPGLADTDMTVYAKWLYTVSFDTKGGDTVDSRTITKNHPVGELPTTAKDEFELEGWYTNDDYTTKISKNTTPTGSTTYYANWNDLCNNFRDDSWSTILNNVTENPDYYQNGCKKYIDYDLENDGVADKVQLRIANTSTPEQCSNSDFSTTGCGLVIEFIQAIERVNMAGSGNDMKVGNYTNGGWKASNVRRYLNSTVINRLPSDLRDIIVDSTVVSGYDTQFDSSNFYTTDKLYVLGLHEVIEGTRYQTDDMAYDQTRQLDNYKLNQSTFGSYSSILNKKYIKVEGGYDAGRRAGWWMRTPHSSTYYEGSTCDGMPQAFYGVSGGSGHSSGTCGGSYAYVTGTISPVFRIGNYHTITYEVGEGETLATAEKTKRNKVGEKIGNTPEPTKEGYFFDEWVKTPGDHSTAINANFVPTEDITLYPTWKKSIASATVSPESIELHKGETATIVLSNVDEEYDFVSNNPAVAKVDNNGVVSWVSTGITSITATGKISKQTKNISANMVSEVTNHTITYNANGGSFSDTNNTKDIHYTKSGAIQKKISHTMNIDSTGKKLRNIGNNWDEYNIRGTDRGSLTSSHVVTIPGAQSLDIEVYYASSSKDSSFATIWKGSHPSYKANDYYTRSYAISGASNLGGRFSETHIINGNEVGSIKRSDFTVTGDTVTIGYKGSNESEYGYYAIITGDTTKLETTDIYEKPTNGDAEFAGWYTDAGCADGSEFNPNLMQGDMTVYAKWLDTIVTFDPTDGTLAQTEHIKRVSSTLAIGALPTPASDTYVFDGWWTAVTGGEQITESSIISESTTVYAHWKDPLSMQQVSTWKSNVAVGEEVIVRDDRDMKMYRAKKLVKGDREFMWMLDDFALDSKDSSGNPRILTADDSDITPNDAYSTFTMPTESWTSSSQNYYCKPIMGKSSGISYYNFSTAFASQYECDSPTTYDGSQQSKVIAASLGTICPKGWTLPDSDVSAAVWDNAANTGQLKYSGYYYSGKASDIDDSGEYWAKSSRNGYIAFWVFSSSGITINSTTGLRNLGHTIRCMAE